MQTMSTPTHSQLKRTALYERHVSLSAKIVPFSGYELPIYYTSLMDEHQNTRQNAGLFDVSHLGEIKVKGDKAFDFLQNMVPTDLSSLEDSHIQYTIVLNEQGGIMDDILIYRLSQESYYLVVNAGNIDKIFKHLVSRNNVGVEISNESDHCSCIAIQGPKALEICEHVFQGKSDFRPMKYYSFRELSGWEDVWISRTGYTGEDGFEFFAHGETIVRLWDLLLDKGTALGLKPCGLGSRNTLRLEVGNSLYGHELREDISPYEARLGWLVSKDKDFVGSAEVRQRKEQGLRQKICGFKVLGKGVARDGYSLYKEGERIGEVTSGSYSPSLKCNIGMGLVLPEHAKIGSQFDIEVHGNFVSAEVVKMPFVPIRHL